MDANVSFLIKTVVLDSFGVSGWANAYEPGTWKLRTYACCQAAPAEEWQSICSFFLQFKAFFEGFFVVSLRVVRTARPHEWCIFSIIPSCKAFVPKLQGFPTTFGPSRRAYLKKGPVYGDSQMCGTRRTFSSWWIPSCVMLKEKVKL